MQIVRKELDVRLLYTHFRGIFKERDVYLIYASIKLSERLQH